MQLNNTSSNSILFSNLIKFVMRAPFSEILWALTFFIPFTAFFFLGGQDWLFVTIAIPILLLGFHCRHQLTTNWSKVLLGFIWAIIAVFAFRISWVVFRHVGQPPVWDFHLFWIYGRVSAQGLNPYEQGNLLQFANNLNPSPGFLKELYFFQLPPLIFLFLPLGWFDIKTATLLWYIFHIAILIFDIVLLWKIIFSGRSYLTLSLVGALTLTLGATLDTLGVAQINFLALLMFLLFWRNYKSMLGGGWLAMGLIVKPVLAFVLLYLFLKRQWLSILGMVLTLTVLSGVTILVFGPGMFFGYFLDNPIVNNMPDYLYTEIVNQSLLATILRVTDYNFSDTPPYTQPIFVTLALIIVGVTSFIVYQLPDQQDKINSNWSLALTLSGALLIFPKTLTHYSILLIVPFLLIWQNRDRVPGGFWVVTIFLTIEYIFISLWGNYIFVGIALNWLVLVGISLERLIKSNKQLHSSTTSLLAISLSISLFVMKAAFYHLV